MAPESPKNLDYDYELLGLEYAPKVKSNIGLIVRWMELREIKDQYNVENFTLYYNPLQELICDYKRIHQPKEQALMLLEELKERIDSIVKQRKELLKLQKEYCYDFNERVAIDVSLNQLMIQMQEIGDEVLDIFQEDSDFRQIKSDPEMPYVANSPFEKILELRVPLRDIIAWVNHQVHRMPDPQDEPGQDQKGFCHRLKDFLS